MKEILWAALSRPALVLAGLLAGCAVGAPAEPQAWPDFVASFAGQPFESMDYPAGITKIAVSANAPSSVEGANGRFARWCSAQRGTSGQIHQLARANKTASTFQDGLAAKANAEQASGLSFVAVSAVGCLRTEGQTLVAVMVSAPGRQGETEIKEGKVLSRLTRVFFTGEQAAGFGSAHRQREEERSRQATSRLEEREAQKVAETRRLRSNPRVGDRTTLGTIVEVRAPLVLLHYDQRYRSMANRPAAEWLPIDSLVPESH